MTKNPFRIKMNDTVDVAADLFERHSFHHLPVVDDEGKLKGILSQVDLMRLSYGRSLFRIQNKEEHNKALYESLWVKDVMTPNVVVIDEEKTIEEAVSIFKENRFHALPVIQKGKLVGILSVHDILLHAFPHA